MVRQACGRLYKVTLKNLGWNFDQIHNVSDRRVVSTSEWSTFTRIELEKAL
jgi:hypothetical protein